MPVDKSSANIGNLLIITGLCTQEELSEALARQANEKHKRLGEILTEMGVLSADRIPGLLSKQKRLRRWGARRKDVQDALDCAIENTAELTHDVGEMIDRLLSRKG